MSKLQNNNDKGSAKNHRTNEAMHRLVIFAMWKSGHAIEPDHVQLTTETLDGFSQALTWHNLNPFQMEWHVQIAEQ